MFGKLHYTPDEFNRMGFLDMMNVIEGYSDEEMKETNRLRHLMWSPLAAMGSKITPKQLIPLPIDGTSDIKPVSKDEFLALAAKMAALDKKEMAKA